MAPWQWREGVPGRHWQAWSETGMEAVICWIGSRYAWAVVREAVDDDPRDRGEEVSGDCATLARAQESCQEAAKQISQ